MTIIIWIYVFIYNDIIIINVEWACMEETRTALIPENCWMTASAQAMKSGLRRSGSLNSCFTVTAASPSSVGASFLPSSFISSISAETSSDRMKNFIAATRVYVRTYTVSPKNVALGVAAGMLTRPDILRPRPRPEIRGQGQDQRARGRGRDRGQRFEVKAENEAQIACKKMTEQRRAFH